MNEKRSRSPICKGFLAVSAQKAGECSKKFGITGCATTIVTNK
ncbi:hypothetical protein [Faecalibacterium wellingii]